MNYYTDWVAKDETCDLCRDSLLIQRHCLTGSANMDEAARVDLETRCGHSDCVRPLEVVQVR